jgi:glycosyltransferase involved in cell wall biosynthesis
MVTSSYPRFDGDTVGTFLEPIAHGVAGRGHEVHVIAPWHPRVQRPAREDNVRFHFYRYAPHPSLNVFGYAGALREDVALRSSALLATPFALAAGWREARRVARRVGATVMHGHWVVPGGATAAAAMPHLPLVVSLHGSDVYLAERHRLVGRIARACFRRAGWVTACSEDLRRRAVALGADAARSEVVPYGVDANRFRPSPSLRENVRQRLGIHHEALVVAVGRLVRKKGFEYLVEAAGQLAAQGEGLHLLIAGAGDLEEELRERAAAAGLRGRVILPGTVRHQEVAGFLAAADVVVVPSVRDDAGNVDGLPNVLLEALASGTPVIATAAGGMGAAIVDGDTGLIVPERDAGALARALRQLLSSPDRRSAIGARARADVCRRFGWDRVAARFEAAYEAARIRQSKTPHAP